MKTIKLATSVAAIILLSAGSAAASGLAFQCDELRNLVGAAENHFTGLGAAVRKRETAADLAARYGVSIEDLDLGGDYENVTLAAAQPLSGADDCEIIDTTIASEEVEQRQTAFQCRYAGLHSIPDSLGKELENCLQKRIDPESDSQSLTIWVDRVESGEGYSATGLEIESNAAEGLTLGIVRTVCLNRSEGGCEDE